MPACVSVSRLFNALFSGAGGERPCRQMLENQFKKVVKNRCCRKRLLFWMLMEFAGP